MIEKEHYLMNCVKKIVLNFIKIDEEEFNETYLFYIKDTEKYLELY